MPHSGPHVIVVGGGGAGLLAAFAAASNHAPVLLLERNRRAGVKILISGGGKCNVTHAGAMDDLRSVFVAAESRFLKFAFARFDNAMLLHMLEQEGVPTVTRPDGRVFPASGRAGQVLAALTAPLARLGVEIRTSTTVSGIAAVNGNLTGVQTPHGFIPSSTVIVATGGASYPKTGTTGDGFRWAAELGHSIVPVRAALAPVRVAPPHPAEWRGVALRGGRLSLFAQGKKCAHHDGDILFSHEGISGPAALEVSRRAALELEHGPVELRYDLFPGTEYSSVDTDLARRVRSFPSRRISTLLEPVLPNRMIRRLLTDIAIDPDSRGAVLTRDQRRAVTSLLKEFRLGTVVSVPLERGEVTAGGVSLRDVNPSTMMSRHIRGLFFCGEVLDIAGPVGGYNLQAAFSTGWVAGEAAAALWKPGDRHGRGESSDPP